MHGLRYGLLPAQANPSTSSQTSPQTVLRYDSGGCGGTREGQPTGKGRSRVANVLKPEMSMYRYLACREYRFEDLLPPGQLVSSLDKTILFIKISRNSLLPTPPHRLLLRTCFGSRELAEQAMGLASIIPKAI